MTTEVRLHARRGNPTTVLRLLETDDDGEPTREMARFAIPAVTIDALVALLREAQQVVKEVEAENE